MQKNIFLFLTIAFMVASTSQGYRQQVYRQQGYMPPKQQPDPSEIRTPLAFVSSTNGSSLGTRIQIQQQGCQFSAGPFGGGGGSRFTEAPDNCNAMIKRVLIRSAALVDGIQIIYRLSNGQSFTGKHHGGGTGVLHTFDINVDQGERVIAVFGKSGQYVDMLLFFTNKGRLLGPYGGSGGGYFSVSSCLVRGILGNSAALLDAIGFFCSHA